VPSACERCLRRLGICLGRDGRTPFERGCRRPRGAALGLEQCVPGREVPKRRRATSIGKVAAWIRQSNPGARPYNRDAQYSGKDSRSSLLAHFSTIQLDDPVAKMKVAIVVSYYNHRFAPAFQLG